MPKESADAVIAASIARRKSIEDIDTVIGQLLEAYDTSSFANLNVLGLNVGQNGERLSGVLATYEKAREIKLVAEAPDPDAAAEVALDAIEPMGRGLNHSGKYLE